MNQKSKKYSQKSIGILYDSLRVVVHTYNHTYIYIYLLLLLLYNSSILDIEHSPYNIALGSTQTHKVI